MGIQVGAAGTNAKIPPALPPLLAADSIEGLDAHRIQPFYTGLLAKACGLAVGITMQGDAVIVAAK
jgi:histidine phosphotransferase ChpT